MTTYLGKIVKAEFGHVGYERMQVGLTLEFKFDSCSFLEENIVGGWYIGNKWNENCKWNVEGNRYQHAEMVEKVSQTLLDAKVNCVSELVNKPIQVEMENLKLVSWRILTEVL